MPDEGLTPQPGDREALIRSAIQSWRDGLINLTGSNRLLNFKPSRTGSVELIRPPAADVLARLTSHGTFGFRALRPSQPTKTQPRPHRMRPVQRRRLRFPRPHRAPSTPTSTPTTWPPPSAPSTAAPPRSTSTAASPSSTWPSAP